MVGFEGSTAPKYSEHFSEEEAMNIEPNYEPKTVPKDELVPWLSSFNFTHNIVVEPSVRPTYERDEIIQHLRQLEFALNKKYLLSSFPKWEPKAKFWMIGFEEGRHHPSSRHFHLLLHSPVDVHKRPLWWMKSSLAVDIRAQWERQWHAYAKPAPKLYIKELESIVASLKYDTKKTHRRSHDNIFFAHEGATSRNSVVLSLNSAPTVH